MELLDAALKSQCGTIFLLTGSIFNVKETIDAIHDAGKKVYMDLDLVDGFSKNTTFLEYAQQILQPDGVITTKSSLAKKAKNMDMFVIQRFFVFDSMSLKSAISSALDVKPNAIEVLPGILGKVIREIREKTRQPVIGSGLISSEEDVIGALEAGAMGITTSNTELWNSVKF